MKNPQTTIAPTFLTHIISDIDGVRYLHRCILEARLEILQNILFTFLWELKPSKFPSEINWHLFKKERSKIALNLKLPFFPGVNHFRECLGYTYNETSVAKKIICNSLKIGINRD